MQFCTTRRNPSPSYAQVQYQKRLQQLVDKALEKEPRDRFQKMEEVRDQLRLVLQEISGDAANTGYQVTAGASTSFSRRKSRIAGDALAKRYQQKDSPTSSPNIVTASKQGIHETPATSVSDPEKKSLAILCFRNLSNDPATSFYEFSLADAVITELARVRSLVVRPSSVIARYQGSQQDPREIGQELGVTAVLTAGFIHSGERFRVTAQLLDVASGDMLWSDRIDTAASDIIALQDTIAQRIVEGLRVELSPSEQDGIGRATTKNPAAYEQYLRGRDLFARFIFRTVAPEDCEAAIQHFERAIELDPDFALAHDGLGALTSIAFSKALAARKITNVQKLHSAKRCQLIQTFFKHGC